jgi:hypothetical protein
LPTIQETAYPRLKSSVSARDLTAIYTPTPQEIALAEQVTRGEVAYLGFLVLLKIFQRLGYFLPLNQVPSAIVEHIAALTGTTIALAELPNYDVSGTRFRHISLIRKSLHIQPYGKEARHALLLAMSEAARTKEELADIINVAIEELVRQKYELLVRQKYELLVRQKYELLVRQKYELLVRQKYELLVRQKYELPVRQKYELPAFDTLVRAARHVRTVLYRQFYQQVETSLKPAEKTALETLFVPDSQSQAGKSQAGKSQAGKSQAETRFTPWNTLKQEPGSPTLTHLKVWLDRQDWLTTYPISASALASIPDVKIKHFAAEAKTLDAARMLEMEPRKRWTLAASLLKVQSAHVLDDLAEMLIKRMAAIHQKGKEAQADYQARNQQRADELVQTLRDLVTAYRSEGTAQEKLAAMEYLLPDRGDIVLQRCEDHMAYAGDNYFPFLWRFYKSHRATLFRLLGRIAVRATTQDTAFEATLRFLSKQEHKIGDWLWLPTVEDKVEGEIEGSQAHTLDLSWMSESWRRLIIEPCHSGDSSRHMPPQRLHRRHFEVCVFSQLMAELKAGDMCVPGSDHFADYRDQLLSWEEYHHNIDAYGAMVGLPIEGDALVAHMKVRLTQTAHATDCAFPDNADLRIENGEPILRRTAKKVTLSGLRNFEILIADRLEPTNLLDVLRDTEYWLHWTRFFGPISGHEAKLDDPLSRYLATTFCYGCQLGPSQAARSLGPSGNGNKLDRRQISWIHWRHITEEGLDKAIRTVINAYHHFALPKRWGTGKSASADGTKWDLYEQNLLSEYHIRYGGYGGIGYYHVSDTYIALFSHFIPCGVWEAVYLLDGLLKNLSDIQPDTIHGDTQAQSTPVFGLASLLGITLMPRIRHWKGLRLYRPDKQTTFTHLYPH